jgi:hypothetical protein
MLPVFAKGKNGYLCLEDVAQLIVKQLYQVGVPLFSGWSLEVAGRMASRPIWAQPLFG